MWLPVDLAITYLPGDTGILYEVDVEGTRVLVDVTNRDGATELADTISFTA